MKIIKNINIIYLVTKKGGQPELPTQTNKQTRLKD